MCKRTLLSKNILFIDSSHVSKTGSDVNHIYFEIIPRLKKGVVVHIHDIFLPSDYPQDWVLNQGRSWNEQYVVRALLMYTRAFEVLFGSAYAVHKYPQLVQRISGGKLEGGGDLQSILFTACGTEADNLAICLAIQSSKNLCQVGKKPQKMNLVVCAASTAILYC